MGARDPNCYVTPFLERYELMSTNLIMEVQRKDTTKIPLGEPMNFTGVIYRSRNDSQIIVPPKAHTSMGDSS